MAKLNRVWEGLVSGYELFLVVKYAPELMEQAALALDGRCTWCGYKIAHKRMHHAPWKHGKGCHID